LIYIDVARPHYSSCDLDLVLIRQTEFWAGFLKSSAKITLLLADPSSATSSSIPASSEVGVLPGHQEEQSQHVSAQSWVCRVCGFSNVPSPKCGLCGVPRDKAILATPPSKSPAPPSPSPSPIPSPRPSVDGLLACPVCTFHNHPSMTRCEICSSPLASTSSSSPSASRPGTPVSATEGPPVPAVGASYVRLSFRRGGEKVFYAALKKALLAKAWEVPSNVSKGKGREDDVPHRLATIGIGMYSLRPRVCCELQSVTQTVSSRPST
jgi:ESCRT-II complex subunit VPS36